MEFERADFKLKSEYQPTGDQPEAIADIVERISGVVKNGVEVAIVVGAGNLWRGLAGSSSGMDRVRADHMGMLATMMNALALKEYFEQSGVPALVQSAFGVEGMLPRYDRDTAVSALEAGKVVIFAGGTGNPFFTTDTASVVRALEINCDAVLKATKVDGIYSADPFKDPDAVRYEEISFDEAIEKRVAKAASEMEFAAGKFDYVLVNDDLQTAFAEAEQIIADFMNR